MTKPWTGETEELVALAIHVADCEDSWEECRSGKAHRRAVHEVLAKLADAGLLVIGGPPKTQDGVSWMENDDTGRRHYTERHNVPGDPADLPNYLPVHRTVRELPCGHEYPGRWIETTGSPE